MADLGAIEKTSLVTGLREATHDLHVRAERSGFIADLLRGRGARDGYVLMLRNLLPAYVALEHGIGRHMPSAIFSGVAWQVLFRVPALQHDLEALAGPAWSASVALLPEGERYARRVTAAAAGNGERLLAHAYTRYLGDLSGGQLLGTMLGRSLGLRPDELSFYSFPGLADAARLKADFRSWLAAAGSRVDRAVVLEEAVAAFQLNIDLSEAVKAAA